MADNEAKARQKLAEAEKKAKPRGGFMGGLLGGSNNVSEACELFAQAANLFKMAKNWEAAGDAFIRSAEIHSQQSDSRHDTASDYEKASVCYRKVDIQKSIECLEKCCELYTDMGRFTMAARHHTTIAEIYESDKPDKKEALKNHSKAADYHKGEEAKSAEAKSLIRVGEISAELGDYPQAISIFEKVAVWEADQTTLKYGAPTHFFMAALCHMCHDVTDTNIALKRYVNQCPAFESSREYKLVVKLLNHIEEQNADEFAAAVKEYDKVSRISPWQTSLLVIAKKKCGDDDEEDLR